jgi:SulP family sulfate permease
MASGAEVWMSPAGLLTMLGLVAVTVLVILLLPKLTKAFPSALAGILAATVTALALGIKTRTVGDLASIRGALTRFHVPRIPYNVETCALSCRTP